MFDLVSFTKTERVILVNQKCVNGLHQVQVPGRCSVYTEATVETTISRTLIGVT